MSSSISNSDPSIAVRRRRAAARAYLLTLLGLILTLAVTIATLAVSLGPPVGDLTRIGGLSERRFGWNATYETYAENLFHDLGGVRAWDPRHAGAVLVFGDSFSDPKEDRASWLNLIAAHVDRPVLRVRTTDFETVLRLVGSESFAAAPPSLVIVQSVERSIAWRAAAIGRDRNDCEILSGYNESLVVRAAPTVRPDRLLSRRTHFTDVDEAFSWGFLAMRRRLIPSHLMLNTPLSRGDLFSSNQSDRLLFYADDVRNHLASAFSGRLPLDVAADMRCGLRRLARIVISRDVVFRLVIAPDKRTAYAPWIDEELPTKVFDVFAEAHRALGALQVDLLDPLRSAIRDGVPDVYWPNDTHWGPPGNRVAGLGVLRSLGRMPAD